MKGSIVIFDVTTGVRQGDMLAPVLFNLFFNSIIAAALLGCFGPLVDSRKKTRREMSIRDFEYADDMALVSGCMGALEEILRTLDASCLRMGPTMSVKKTKILAIWPTS